MRDDGHRQCEFDGQAIEIDLALETGGVRDHRVGQHRQLAEVQRFDRAGDGVLEDRVHEERVRADRLDLFLHEPRLGHDVGEPFGGCAAGATHRHLQDRDPVAGTGPIVQRHGHVGD